MVTIVILIRQWLNGAINFDKSTKDLSHLGPARIAASDENVRQLETALRANRCIKVRELSQMLSISVRTVHSIIHSIGYHKVDAQWIPRQLTDEQKNVRPALSLQHNNKVMPFYTKLLPVMSLGVITMNQNPNVRVCSGNMHNLRTVSYTHLDVYKRQGLVSHVNYQQHS